MTITELGNQGTADTALCDLRDKGVHFTFWGTLPSGQSSFPQDERAIFRILQMTHIPFMKNSLTENLNAVRTLFDDKQIFKSSPRRESMTPHIAARMCRRIRKSYIDK